MFDRPGSSNGRQKSKTIKNPSGFQQNPKKSLDQDLAPQKSHAEFPNLNGIQYTAKSKDGWFGNWSLVIVTGHWAFGLDCSQSPIFS